MGVSMKNTSENQINSIVTKAAMILTVLFFSSEDDFCSLQYFGFDSKPLHVSSMRYVRG